jgi:hypothetical protein
VALVTFPPSRDAFPASTTKPEAFASIDPTTIDQVLREEADRAAEMALSDRATFPILQISEGFQGAIFGRVGWRLMGVRGYNRDAGADKEIETLKSDADAYLAACVPGGPGGDGKRITPQFVDSRQNTVVDGVSVDGHANSDWYARSRMDPERTRRWPPS